MLALYCPDKRSLRRVESALPTDAARVTTGWWPDFAHAVPAADCSVIVVERLAAGTVVPRLRVLKRLLPLHPVVLVTSSDPENARLLAGLPIEQAVWTSEIEQMLRPAVERARTGGLRHRTAAAIEAAAHLPLRVREALALACRSNPPIHTVAALARAVGCDRRTLWLDWRAAFPVPPFRFEDFVGWLLLLHAAGRKMPDRSWAAVAVELHVHRQTLARLAKRLMGVKLSELAVGSRPEVARRFARDVVEPLIRDQEMDKLRHI